MRSKPSYYTVCPECENRISLTLAAKLQAGRSGTSCICSGCKHTWVCIQEWIINESVANAGMNAVQPGMIAPNQHRQPSIPVPHFQHQPISMPNSNSQQTALFGQPRVPHLPTFQPSTFQQTAFGQQSIPQQTIAQQAVPQTSTTSEQPMPIPTPHWLSQPTLADHRVPDTSRHGN